MDAITRRCFFHLPTENHIDNKLLFLIQRHFYKLVFMSLAIKSAVEFQLETNF